MLSPFDIGTVATFSCNAGFSLNDSTAMLNCTDDDQADTVGTWNGIERLNCIDDDQADTIGTWSGTEPSCLGKYFSSLII